MAIGYVTHLDYKSPYLNPSEEFNRFKAHPSVQKLLRDAVGKRLKYGARVITLSSVGSPRDACYPGCTVIGCAFGVVNTLKLKGLAMALESGCKAAINYISASGKSSENALEPWLSRKDEAKLA